MAGTTNNDAQQLRQGPPGPGKRSGYFLAVIQSLSITYCLAAALVSVFMLVVLLNSAFGGGAPGITLPVGASGGTAVPALQTGTEIADAHFTEVVFSAWGLSPLAALLYYAPNVLVPVAHALIAWSVHKLAVAAGTPRPFGPPPRAPGAGAVCRDERGYGNGHSAASRARHLARPVGTAGRHRSLVRSCPGRSLQLVAAVHRLGHPHSCPDF